MVISSNQCTLKNGKNMCYVQNNISLCNNYVKCKYSAQLQSSEKTVKINQNQNQNN